MGGRGASSDKKFNEIKARYEHVNNEYEKYAKVLNYSNKSEYRDMFDKLSKAREELREVYSEYANKHDRTRKKNVPF